MKNVLVDLQTRTVFICEEKTKLSLNSVNDFHLLQQNNCVSIFIVSFVNCWHGKRRKRQIKFDSMRTLGRAYLHTHSQYFFTNISCMARIKQYKCKIHNECCILHAIHSSEKIKRQNEWKKIHANI